TNWNLQVVACSASTNALSSAASDPTFSLSGATANEAVGQYLVEAIIYGVAEADAQAISQRIDAIGASPAGGQSSAPTLGTDGKFGKVKYTAPTTPGAPVDVAMYLTHR